VLRLSAGNANGENSVDLAVTVEDPVSGFAAWQNQYWASGTSTAITGLQADPDGDGSPNILEFAYGGDPTKPGDIGERQMLLSDGNNDGRPDLLLTLEVRAGAVFSPDGSYMTAVIDGVVCRIEGSLDLLTFTSPVSEVSPHRGAGTPTSGYVFKTFRLNAANGLPARGFLRARATVP